MSPLLTLQIHYEQDVVQARQRTRELAEQLGFDTQDQARLATAVSEIARNAFQYAQGGTVTFFVDGDPQSLRIQIQDQGKGIPHLHEILANRYTSQTGMGIGIVGTRRLMDIFEIETLPDRGTTVVLGKQLPKRVPHLTAAQLDQMRQTVLERSPQTPYEEILCQNQELLRAMAELRKREEELTQLNRELEDTNRGVVALYAELDEKATSLQQATEVKTRFFSNMSHEFRTPLNSILSLSRMLLSRLDGDLTPEQEKQVTFIQRAADGLSELVNDLLDLTKAEAGKIEVRPSYFEISDLFGTLRGMLRPLLVQGAAVTLLFEEPAPMPPLYTDEGKVAQILRNFISNALKFTEQGEVRVTAVQTDDHTITFSVSDTGIGIAPPDQERIFEDFVQIESQLQKRVKGTGLGLPLSRRLAELLGGRVVVQSDLGQGATFSALIPIIYPAATDPPAVQPPQASSGFLAQLPRHRPDQLPILVIEDNAETLFIYERYLHESRYQLIKTSTLVQARQVLQQLRPAAIMLDILLDGQNGWTLLQELKSDETTRTIPIVVMTVVDNEKQALALGADSFLIKPIDRLPLLAQLNTLINQGKPQTLLLIDDDPAARYVVQQLLAHTPLQILAAATGQEGLAIAYHTQPSGILLDLKMPDMSGFAVLDQLKGTPTTAAIPIIIHSSARLDAATRQRLAAHSIGLLAKEASSQAAAITQLQDALIRAGFVLDPGGSHA